MNICVYGASSDRINGTHLEAAERLGRLMAQRGHSLIYGGGATGMMGAVARGVHSLGGRIIGVSPEFFNVDGELFQSCTEMIYTESMSARKRKMDELSSAFVVTAGGLGTFDEFFDILTLKNLGLHHKPIGILNSDGWFDSLHATLKRSVEQGFIFPIALELFQVFSQPEQLLEYIENQGI